MSTVFRLKTAALPLHLLLGDALTGKTREYQVAIREGCAAVNLPVIGVFGKGVEPLNLPTMLDGEVIDSSYMAITCTVEVDATPEEVEAACANLQIPGFPATAWQFPES
ncbi:hypothetical protein CPI83_29405 (plasmid) [Rhodococcus sp. H-CA8f]|uniref:hypothetical protein n=1 Tax=Rhodococcus sp. H-CA8f TaxID=1727214 RepID=UPI000BE34DE9|nr:hypothetical protein [Rhodococcus sp. H-CA8f]ATI36320.1 hypothetical protein CPI83_29405 [Rhodococcus sp. H-CA8f]